MRARVLPLLVVAAVAFMLAGMAGSALATISSGNASGAGQGSIVGTDHDLSSSGGGTIKGLTSENDNEICVWCHTPHGANNTAIPRGGLLWNKPGVDPNLTFKMYSPIASNIQFFGNNKPDPGSMLCLSCHDGVSAVNALVLTAQSGSTGDFIYNASGTDVSFGGNTGAVEMGGSQYGVETGAYNLGTDLSGTHPVGVLWPTTEEAGLPAWSTAQTIALGSGWLGETSGATIGDLVHGPSGDVVNCESCHDPHDNYYGDFLRHSNSGSALCLTCHSVNGTATAGGGL